MKRSLQEVRSFGQAKPKETNHFDFDKQFLSITMVGTPEDNRKMPEYKRLILVWHPTDEKKWFVHASLAPQQALLMLCYEGLGYIIYQGRMYIPLPIAEQGMGCKLENFRQVIARKVKELQETQG